MSYNSQLTVASNFRRAEPNMLKGHPLRGSLREKLQQENSRHADTAPDGTRWAGIRDAIISILGVVSATIPMLVAFQSIMGA